MSITQDGFTFNGFHGPMISGPPEVPLQVYRVAGIKGESHLAGRAQGRPVSCTYIMYNHASWQALHNAMDSIDEQQMQLGGTVTVTGNAAATIPRMTFMGFQRTGKPFLDGTGVYGWVQFGRLFWIQRRI